MKNASLLNKSAILLLILIFIIGCSSNSTETDPGGGSGDPVDPTPSRIQVSTYATVQAGDGLTIDSNGNLFAANYGNSKVYKINTSRSVSLFIDNQPGAAGMAFDSQGVLHLARYNSSDIVKISDQGTVTSTLANGVAAPIALAFDSHGNLFTNNNVNSAVTKIDVNGNKEIIRHTIHNNSSVTLDDDNNIYVSDYATGKIIKIDATTSTVTTFVNLPINGGVGFIIYSDGFFYATAIADEVIYRISKQGVADIIAGRKGITGHVDGDGDAAKFSKPNGLVASADGKTLYVAQQGGSGAIRVITGFRD